MQNKCFRWDEGKSSRAHSGNIAGDELFSWKYNTFHAGYDDNRLSYINSTGGSTVHCSRYNGDV